MGALVLVRPANQVLIVMALLPLLVRAPWSRRLAWLAAFFIASAVVTQGWKALADLRYSDAVALTPSGMVLAAALVLLPLLLPAAWRWRLAAVAVPLVAVVVVVKGPGLRSPVHYVRTAAQAPSSDVFLFRAFELDRIVQPDNGPASREMGHIVQRELLAHEPYRSYGIDLQEFFGSGSDRMFGDLTNLPGVDLPAVTDEAIGSHPWTFAKSIATTVWQQLWARRVYAATSSGDGSDAPAGGGESDFIVVDGKRLPRPSGGEPIPASRIGPEIRTLRGGAREEWRSASEHPLVFDDPRDAQRYARFERDTDRLVRRIPTRDANDGLVHRLNQTSHAFPPLLVWLVVGVVGLAVRRPQGALEALAPALAALVVIVATSLVALAVAEYAVPVSPAFVLLAAVGLVGAHPRRPVRLPWRGQGG
jgi:hypothetical protein